MSAPFPFAGVPFPCFALDDTFTICQANPAGEALQLPPKTFCRLLSEEDCARLRQKLPLQLPWNHLPGSVCTLELLPMDEGFAALLQPTTPYTSGYARALEHLMETLSGVFATLPSVHYFLSNEEQGSVMLEYSLRQSYRILRAVNDQLWSVRLCEGYQPFCEVLDLDEMLRLLCEAVNTTLPKASLTYQGAEQPVPVSADRDLLELAITHLLNNSLTFGDEEPVTVRLARQGEHAIVSITDAGTGLQPQVAAHAFEAFYSCDPYCDTDTLPGEGLGLFLVQQGLRAMGGECALESEYGHGTRASFMLPLAGEAAEGGRMVHAKLSDYLLDRLSCVYLQFCPLGAQVRV